MKSVEILIPNRYTWNAICLTIESIWTRTEYPGFRITVCDNSQAPNNRSCEPERTVLPGQDDGSRIDYLRAMAASGIIKLIENWDQPKRYGHGENLKILLDQCSANYAFLFNSTAEIVRPDWISVLVDALKDPERDLGVARFRSGGAREHDYIAPTYWPNMMLLDMRLYRKHFPGHGWELRQIGFENFNRPEIFAGQAGPAKPERRPPLVFCDTGYTLWEKLEFDNPAGLRMVPLPDNYWNTHIIWRGGIDRNSHRPDHPHVVETLAEINRRLAALRGAH